VDWLGLLANALVAVWVVCCLGVAVAHDTRWVKRRLALLDERAAQVRAEGYKVNLFAVYAWAFRTRLRALATAFCFAAFWFWLISYLAQT
jgi:hypothetical protein